MERTSTIYPPKKRTPSFSSSLLDAIYRSIDDSNSNLHQHQHHSHSHETPIHTPTQSHRDITEKFNLRPTVMLEDWTETQSSHSYNHFFNNSTSSSSESTFFSSSETDTTPKPKLRVNRNHIQPLSLRFVKSPPPKSENKKPSREGGFVRTKLKALKQPISPGSRIASFLSSIFNSAGNVKKAKMCNVGAVEDVTTFEHTSKSPSCFSSSASSFSRRSCMSKTKPSNGAKRSVRFYPVSVILGEDASSQPCGHRYSTYENDPSLLPLPRTSSIEVNKKNKKKKNFVVAKENGFNTKGYQSSGKGNMNKFGFRGFYDHEDDDDDGDDLSCSSSDLFELDHLIGAGRYQEELPVYETTNLEMNKAIANGLRL